MKKYRMYFTEFLFILILAMGFTAPADAAAPDKAQQALDTMAVQCQNLNDFYYSALNGDFSLFSSEQQRFYVAVNNIDILLSGYDNRAIQTLWNAYAQFSPNPDSVKYAADICSQVRADLYQRIMTDSELSSGKSVSSFDDCVRAGYSVSGDACFIGGTPVYDEYRNLIGYYYCDCFDQAGFHQGTCWDCYYGADANGCIAKP